MHKYLKGGVQKTDPGASQWCLEQDKLNFLSNIRKKCFSSDGRQTHCPESLWVPILGDTPNPARHSRGQIALPEPALSRGVDQAISRGPVPPQPLCDAAGVSLPSVPQKPVTLLANRSQHPGSDFPPQLLGQTPHKQVTEQEGKLTITQEVLFD